MSTNVRFELELAGGDVERRYRKLRAGGRTPPWGSLDARALSDEQRLDSQRRWTRLAFAEYASSIGMLEMTRALIEASAPLDLTALASRFVTDELAHAELCAMMAMELGGATEILYDPDRLFEDRTPEGRPLLRAAELVLSTTSVDEVVSLSLLRGLYRATSEPLTRSVLRVILRDEVTHASLGGRFLDWALPSLDEREAAQLAAKAQLLVERFRTRIAAMSASREPFHAANALAWMDTEEARSLRTKSLEEHVVGALRARGLDLV